MNTSNYEVVYIDKFTNPDQAAEVMSNLTNIFQLNFQAQTHLASGNPVVIKHHIDRDMAKRYISAIENAGGCCWVQELSVHGKHRERRSDQRRSSSDRRGTLLASSIQPDRRGFQERRKTYLH